MLQLFSHILMPLVDFHLHLCHLLALPLTEVAGAPGMSTACDVQPIAADICCSFQSVAWKVSEMHVLKRFGVTIEGVFFVPLHIEYQTKQNKLMEKAM